MIKIEAEIAFGPNTRHIADYENRDGDLLVQLVDADWMEGNWAEYMQSTTGESEDGDKAFGLLHLAHMKGLNFYMFDEDMDDGFTDGEWDLESCDEVVEMVADSEEVSRYSVYKLTFRLVSGDRSAFEGALQEHLQMIEQNIGPPRSDLNPEQWLQFKESCRGVGVEWDDVEPITLMNPRVSVSVASGPDPE